MTLVQLYCRLRGHRTVEDFKPITFEGKRSTALHCVRCHEPLWLIE